MKALSLWQPWATLVAVGAKQNETRHWSTGYRGSVAIHAAKRKPDYWPKGSRDLVGSGLPFGAVVAVAHLVDVVATDIVDDLYEVTDQERGFGDYSNGRYVWMFGRLERLKAPLIMRGRQGLWTLTEVEEAVVVSHLQCPPKEVGNRQLDMVFSGDPDRHVTRQGTS